MKQEASVWYYAFRCRMFGQEPILLQGSAILIGYSHHFNHTLNLGKNFPLFSPIRIPPLRLLVKNFFSKIMT